MSAGDRARWGNEAGLATAFADAAVSSGWTVYPEVRGWDLVLARTTADDSVETVAVQAKLSLSWRVLAQATKSAVREPDWRAVLVPRYDRDFADLCTDLGVGLYTGDRSWCPVKPLGRKRVGGRGLVLPSVPGVGVPGARAPEQLTQWRERAIVLCAVLRSRGYLTGADFDRLRVRRAFWLESGWVTRATGPDAWITDAGRRVASYIPGSGTLPDSRYSEDTRTAVTASWLSREPWIADALMRSQDGKSG